MTAESTLALVVLVDLHEEGIAHVCHRSQEEAQFHRPKPVCWPKCKFMFKRPNPILSEN